MAGRTDQTVKRALVCEDYFEVREVKRIGVAIILTVRHNKSYFFISVFNQLDAQNLFHNKLYSLWYHHTYKCDDTRGCVMQC